MWSKGKKKFIFLKVLLVPKMDYQFKSYLYQKPYLKIKY